MFDDLSVQEHADRDAASLGREEFLLAAAKFNEAGRAVRALEDAVRPFWQIIDDQPPQHDEAEIAHLVAVIGKVFDHHNDEHRQRLRDFDWAAGAAQADDGQRPFEAMRRIVLANGALTPGQAVQLTFGRLRQSFRLLCELMKGVMLCDVTVYGERVEGPCPAVWVRAGLKMLAAAPVGAEHPVPAAALKTPVQPTAQTTVTPLSFDSEKRLPDLTQNHKEVILFLREEVDHLKGDYAKSILLEKHLTLSDRQVDRIVACLIQRGYVESKKGPHGGWRITAKGREVQI